ncbi:MAG: class I SAM-dependent methyltransferase [Ignavibacteriae bacterium]|nr:class I SAM-dependent methyltransferase [Ignavibacteriota bacterium]
MHHCPSCSSQSLKDVLWGTTALKQCLNCSLFFLRDMPHYDDTIDYYASSYVLQNNITTTNYHYERRRIARLPEQIFLLSKLISLLPPRVAMIDIGCDRGFFLDEARRFGYKVLGIEPSISAREACNTIGIPVLPSLDEVKGQFDCVVMWHSLEHFPEPAKTIRQINGLISKGGILAVRVPDFGSFWSRLLRHRWKWFQPHQHYVHYNVASLEYLLKHHGYEIISLKSRRANTLTTMRSQSAANRLFAKNLGIKASLFDYASQWYHYIASIELFCIAKKI